MVYNPTNVQAYTAAFSGAVSGMAVNGWITSPDGSNYALVCGVAGAFAQAFDVVWDSATALNGLEYSAIQQACQQEFAQRGPGPLSLAKFSDPDNWAVPAKACATLALQCDVYYAGQGITPPALGGAGQEVLIAQTTASGSAAAGTSAVLLATLFTFLSDPVSLRTNPQFLITGILNGTVPSGAETQAIAFGNYLYELSIDGGVTFVAYNMGSPAIYSAITNATGTPAQAAINLPVFLAVSGAGDITGDVILRTTVLNDSSSTDTLTLTEYIGYQITQPFPS